MICCLNFRPKLTPPLLHLFYRFFKQVENLSCSRIVSGFFIFIPTIFLILGHRDPGVLELIRPGLESKNPEDHQDLKVGIRRDWPEDRDLETRIPDLEIKHQIFGTNDLGPGMTRGRPDDQKLQVMLIIARNGQDRDLEIGLRERMNIPDVPCRP